MARSQASTPRPPTFAAHARRRSSAWGSRRSTSIISIASTPMCRSRRRSARWRSWCARGRSGTWGSPKPGPRPSAARRRFTRSRRFSPNIRSGSATWRRKSCRSAASSASASCPTARSGAASSPARSSRATISRPTTGGGRTRVIRKRISPPTSGSWMRCGRWRTRTASHPRRWRSPGCWRRAKTSCRSQARSAARRWRTAWRRPT